MFRVFVAALLLAAPALPSPAFADSRSPRAADPGQPVPAIEYRSPLADYKKPAFDAPADWRKANETVRDVGGHGGALSGKPPAEGGHAGHKH